MVKVEVCVEKKGEEKKIRNKSVKNKSETRGRNQKKKKNQNYEKSVLCKITENVPCTFQKQCNVLCAFINFFENVRNLR